MPKHLFYLSALIIFMTSCRSQYAPIQETRPLSYRSSEKKLKVDLPFLKKKEIEVEIRDIEKPAGKIQVKRYFPEIKIKPEEIEIPQVVEEKVEIEKEILTGGDPDKEKLKEKKKRKRRRMWRQFGSNLLIGFVFLGVAIILALIKLQTLAILFGVASILFLIFGLKKLFKKRRRRIRNPFKKNK
ncbi:hypothetical protein [Jiulongibacter sp. NS-SX5]|uniref:hypothetical protein n=1 Tax=Jiulongibacter sp. NS-SX5 TaxID=3463854 RepID=UPI0040599DA7